MTSEWSSLDKQCRVTATPLSEYRMGVWPERLTIYPPVPGVEHFYFMGGHVEFDEAAKCLLLWDDSDVVLFHYLSNEVYSYHGPLFARISRVSLIDNGKTLSVEGWQRAESFTATLVLGSKDCPAGVGCVSDGIFSSTPASEHPRRASREPRPSLLKRLFS